MHPVVGRPIKDMVVEFCQVPRIRGEIDAYLNLKIQHHKINGASENTLVGHRAERHSRSKRLESSAKYLKQEKR